jgi:hypothetical protein
MPVMAKTACGWSNVSSPERLKGSMPSGQTGDPVLKTWKGRGRGRQRRSEDQLDGPSLPLESLNNALSS